MLLKPVLMGTVLALLLSRGSASLQAQQVNSLPPQGADYEPRSGDAWVDRHLVDMGDYAARYPHSFADELARYFDVQREYVLALLQQPGWTAGDVYMACALAKRKSQPCRTLVRARAGDQEEDGWEGVVARAPGDELAGGVRDLRQDITASYLRWARPLQDQAGR